MKSVLQDWVMELTLRQQGVLVLALRGPDGARKEDPAKPIVRTLRALVMNSGREGCPMAMGSHFEGDAFMRTDLIADPRTWIDVCQRFYSSIDQYNIHFLQHLWHAYALLGVFHPLEVVQWHSMQFYLDGAKKLHFNPETRDEITYRLRDGIRPESDE